VPVRVKQTKDQMTQFRKYHPVLEKRLLAFAEIGDAAGLLAFLRTVSHADFRTASYLLREKLLPSEAVAPRFWQLFATLVPADSKAYLGTFLKAAIPLFQAGRIEFDFVCLESYSAQCTPIDCRKLLDSWLPFAKNPDELRSLLQLFCPEDDEIRIGYLLQVNTGPACFELFQRLRRLEHRPAEVRRCCLHLMQRGDKRSFNLAGILQKYFDLGELPGTFSLRLEHYQLGRLDESYEKFLKILNN